MLYYIVRRFIYMLVLLLALSVTAFIIIQLPPGDYVEMYVRQLQVSGQSVDQSEVVALRRQYGLDLPGYVRYFRWMWRIFQGDFGRSFAWNKPVTEVVRDRLPLTVIVSLFVLVFTYGLAIPIGIYSATHQYSTGDYIFTIFGFAGLATPNFLFALVLMVFFYKYLNLNMSGLFSPEYAAATWSIGKFIDMLRHLPIPIVVIGSAGTAGIIRVMRACLLDELQKQYVISARAKGVRERTLLFKYPVRVAVNPVVSTIGWTLPAIVSGETITAIVLNLPTVGPLFYRALLCEDMYLAGAMVLFLGFLTIVGTFISDLMLIWIDPRIKYEKLPHGR